MTNSKDPLNDELTPSDHDEHGNAREPDDDADAQDSGDSKNEPNPGESPLG